MAREGETGKAKFFGRVLVVQLVGVTCKVLQVMWVGLLVSLLAKGFLVLVLVLVLAKGFRVQGLVWFGLVWKSRGFWRGWLRQGVGGVRVLMRLGRQIFWCLV